jgi:hypothetical protein
VRAALGESAAAGPFFRLAGGAAGPSWQQPDRFYRDALAGLLADTAVRLGTAERRVAASIMHLGYAARLWSPVLGCALLRQIVPDLGALRIAATPQLRLGLAQLSGWHQADPHGQAALIYDTVVGAHLEPLARAMPVKIAAGLLRGNAASAMAGALGELARYRPPLRAPARELAALLLATGTLRGAGQLTGPGLGFVRASCCLYYRVPGGGICSDCPLGRPG